MRHESDPNRRVTVARHNKDIKKGTLEVIIKQAGMSVDEFLGYL